MNTGRKKQKKETIFSLCDTPYSPADIADILEGLEDPPIAYQQKLQYINIPCAFDTETTSFMDDAGNKAGTVYCWTLGINGKVIFGRTYPELLSCFNAVIEFLNLHVERRLIFYVHNLAYDFQFFRHLFTWHNVFSLDVRKPLYACTENGIEFRCSYLLTGYSLEKVGEHLTKYPVKKLKGDLDYSLIRNIKTPMSDKEIQYCVHDVLVIMAHIQERIEIDGSITRIPLTKTGYVRKRCRNACLYRGSHKKGAKKYLNYMAIMKDMQLTSREYKQLKRCFQGGFTHANAWKSQQVWHNVRSYDFTSSYPAVMVCEQFPMSRGEYIAITSKEQFERNLRLYCCMFELHIEGLEGIQSVDHPLSYSKCHGCVNVITNNGRVVSADSLDTIVTETDFRVLQRFYTWKSIGVRHFCRYRKGYLPTPLVDEILTMYESKTQLKDVAGMEVEYMASKGDVNAAYGMMVTDICREIISYIDNEWQDPEAPDFDSSIDHYNTGKRRFLSYPWGVWVTSYARRNLFTGILEFGSDYLYGDTDSIKAINSEKHVGYIKSYNHMTKLRMEHAMQHHGFPVDRWRPKTIKGIEKPLGYWDDEGMYDAFKALGAKRYMTLKDGKYSITVSGINKYQAVPYMMEHFVFSHVASLAIRGIKNNKTVEELMFGCFSDKLYIPPNRTGKKVHTYIDTPIHGHLTDYLGNTAPYYEASCIHLGPADYSLSLSRYYVDFLLNINQVEEFD